MRILVSLWPGLGDIMFATPALRILRRKFPEAQITAALLDGGPGKALLETNPFINEILAAPKGTVYSLWGIWKWARKIRTGHYDVGIELSFPVLWLLRLAGIPKRVRFGRRPFWWLVPYRDQRDRNLHASEHFLRAIDKLDGRALRDDRGYDLVLMPEDEKRAEEIILDFGMRNADSKILIAVHPGGRCNKNKRWDLGKFGELCERLVKDFEARIFVVGGKDDSEAGDALANRLNADTKIQNPKSKIALNLAGKLALRETAAVAKRCRLFIGNDSGPIHIISAVGTPIISILASSNPANFRPLSRRFRVVQPDAPCVGCFRFPGYMNLAWGLRLRWVNQCRAMEKLKVEQVYEACAELLNSH
jgi:ADP-heptose:LPS heptosyltransferase